jgi:hypothetical protein
VFDKLDSWLITFFQWIVRQVELFTNISRKDLLYNVMLIAKWVTLVNVCFSLWFTFSVGRTPLFSARGLIVAVIDYLTEIVWVLALIFWFIFCEYKRRKQVSNPQILPEEILSMKSARWSILFISFFWTFCVLLMVLTPTIPDPIHDFRIIETWLGCGYFFFINCFAYLLCTTSLPPGEKEKQKMKREMKNISPQVT